ncbi:HAD family hydrolase [Paenalkalicoccus suaedae]|uniref:HAD family hydrolase n=1 Tax=Paenalkalicoccus suaedae TaxID=2592382 RepID=A0A859FG44_9BACI|nr:HAD family hydrolase [Paenalkalicoccus suaedae]QKS71175.1 HAD family hydrolase [Paenalkalicoccus suaedae]
MKKALLFDLDGTLLPMDTHAFVEQYTRELAPKVAHIVDPETFLQALFEATAVMMKNTEAERTNEAIFTEAFLARTGLEKEDIWPTLDIFYEETFPQFKTLTEPTSLAAKVIQKAYEKGYKIAIATNPVFPKVAIWHRLKWAGIDKLPLDHVTVYEESTFTKPHLTYYEMIAKELDVDPSQCVMIGNDKQEDMVAEKIGMRTFLVHGNVIDRGTATYQIDDEGTLEELYEKLSTDSGVFA